VQVPADQPVAQWLPTLQAQQVLMRLQGMEITSGVAWSVVTTRVSGPRPSPMARAMAAVLPQCDS
jgi:hypothetical protein